MDSQVSEFLTTLWQGGKFGYFLSLPYPHTTWTDTQNIQTVAQRRGGNLYFGVHPVELIPPCNSEGEIVEPHLVRGRNENVEYVNCVFAEFDAGESLEEKEKVLAHIRRLKIQPSVIVDSGGGYHCYYLLNLTWWLDESTRSAFARLQARFVDYVHADTCSKDLARVLRVPGTLNYKYNPPRMVQFVEYDLARRYSMTQIKLLLPRLSLKPKASLPLSVAADLAERLIRHALRQEGRNNGGFWLALQLRDNGYGVVEAQQFMRAYAARTAVKKTPYTEREAMASVAQVYKHAPRAPLEQRSALKYEKEK